MVYSVMVISIVIMFYSIYTIVQTLTICMQLTFSNRLAYGLETDYPCLQRIEWKQYKKKKIWLGTLLLAARVANNDRLY